jgi:hypothetical protein
MPLSSPYITNNLPSRDSCVTPFRIKRKQGGIQVKRLLVVIVALLACKMAYAGWTIGNVRVQLTGSDERQIVLADDDPVATYTYTAVGEWDELQGEVEDEEGDPTTSAIENYTWTLTPPDKITVVSGGNEGDTHVTISFAADWEGLAHVCVEYEVTTLLGERGGGGSATDGIFVAVPTWSTPLSPVGTITGSGGDYIFPGEEVVVGLIMADYDKRQTGEGETSVSDSCSGVTWTATCGKFKDDDNTGSIVTWISPSGGGVSVTFHATATDAAVVPPRETGTRDDSDLVKNKAMDLVAIGFDKDPVEVGIGEDRGSHTPAYPPTIPATYPHSLIATVTPKGAADEVTFDSSNAGRFTVDELARYDEDDDMHVILVVTGVSETPALFPDGDTTVRAKTGATVSAECKGIVIKPTTQTHAAADLPKTSFATPLGAAPGKVRLATMYGTNITIEVFDQFGDALHAVYDGAPVAETFVNVSQTNTQPPYTGAGSIGFDFLNPSGHFLKNGEIIDQSGAVPMTNYDYDVAGAVVADWLSADPWTRTYICPRPMPLVFTGTTVQIQTVLVDGCTLTPTFRRTRTAQGSPTNSWTTRDVAEE